VDLQLLLTYISQVIRYAKEETPSTQYVIPPHVQHKIRSDYYGLVRRLPSKAHCEILIRNFFSGINNVNCPLEETFFREQLRRWWDLAYSILLERGPEELPEDLKFFPALLFQVLAISLQFLPRSYDSRLCELRFGPTQTFVDLSREYSSCGVATAQLLKRSKPTLVGVQQSFLRDSWLVNEGDILTAWEHSGKTVKYNCIFSSGLYNRLTVIAQRRHGNGAASGTTFAFLKSARGTSGRAVDERVAKANLVESVRLG
jgi:hypothetical protein